MNLIDSDLQQRKLALDPAKSFIVQAPAGSGKTELLIQRFLTLLNHVKKPEEILAITFTKKAANEMRLRVIKALKHALTDPEPESAHGKQTWKLARQVLARDEQYQWNLIQNPNQLRIQTIDSLCTYLTRQLPLLSHFGSQPDIADSPTILYHEAAQEVLLQVEQNNEWSAAIALLLLHLDNDLNKLHDLLATLLAKRDQWLNYIQYVDDTDTIRKLLESHLAAVVSDALKHVSKIFPHEIADELLSCARFAADNLIYANSESPVTACRDLQQLPGSHPADKQIWRGLAKLLLTEEGGWRKTVNVSSGFPAASSAKNPQEKTTYTRQKELILELLNLLQDHDDLRMVLHNISFLPDECYQDAQWQALQALLSVLKILAAQLRVTFQQHGKIDFIENARAALIALGNDETPTDLALALDYQIRHILIDEFQDTSYSQYQLLEKLTTGWEPDDGRTLFVVGDPMQSIYRFREAEVGLFIRMRTNGIGHIKLIPLTLALNFRSSAKIVEWNNSQFENIFPAYNDIATGAVTYSPSISNTDNGDDQSEISLHGFADADEETQGNQIAELIGARIKQSPDGKIAILIRSRTHLKSIIPALKRCQIPYRAVDIDLLESRQCIQDLLSLTCALLHPADRIAWLAVLRAPWCGLTLADLLVIAGGNPHATIPEQLDAISVMQNISPDGQRRINKILPVLKTKMAQRERDSLRLWIESGWLLLGGPACLSDPADMNDAKAFFSLLDEFAQNSPIINIDQLKNKIRRLYASTDHDGANVQIMTIHSAKGLEFETVILPHLERKPSADDSSLLSWMEQPLSNDQNALLLAPIHATGTDKDLLYEYISRQQRIKSKYEIERLFYVAATRAKKHLHLFFNVTQKEDQTYKIESGSFLEKIWPMIEKKKDSIISKSNYVINTDIMAKPTPRQIKRLMTEWHNPVRDTHTVKTASHLQQGGFKLISNQYRLTGVVLHKILQLFSIQGYSWWTNCKPVEQINYVKRQLRQHGLANSSMEVAINTVLSAISHTLEDKRGQWILHPHQDAKSEYAITAILDQQIENLVLDRTFVDESGIRWIIDYKTTTLTHEDMEEFLAREQDKYLEKMRKYSRAIRMTDPRPVRMGLYFPALPAWREWTMDI